MPTPEIQYTYGSTCYCPIRPLAYRAPNDEEFAIAYNQTIAYEYNEGYLQSSYTVTNVENDDESEDDR